MLCVITDSSSATTTYLGLQSNTLKWQTKLRLCFQLCSLHVIIWGPCISESQVKHMHWTKGPIVSLPWVKQLQYQQGLWSHNVCCSICDCAVGCSFIMSICACEHAHVKHVYSWCQQYIIIHTRVKCGSTDTLTRITIALPHLCWCSTKHHINMLLLCGHGFSNTPTPPPQRPGSVQASATIGTCMQVWIV